MQFRHFLVELLRQEVDLVLVGLKVPSGHRGRRKDLPRLDVVDVHAYQAL